MPDQIDTILDADDTPNVDETALQEERGRYKRPGTRRAVLAAIAGVVMLAAPLVIAKSVIGDSDGDGDVATKDGESAALIAHRSTGEAGQSDAVQRKSLQARQTTTTTAKPKPKPTTTTAPPPPPTTTPPRKVAPPPTAPPTTAPPVTAASAPALPGNGGLGDPNLDATWDHLAQCESGGNWAINTGNGFYGGIQFTLQSWHGVGGNGYPNQASRETQIAMGKRLWQVQGWAAWPGCTSKFGWR